MTAGRELALVLAESHALVERRRYPSARKTVARGLQAFPDSLELSYLAAYIDYAEGHADSAMRGVRAVLSLDPQHYGARRLCAHLLEDAKQFAEAERVWIELLREYPLDADCYAAYAELMLTTLHIDKARRLAAEGLRHAPQHAGCLYLVTLVDFVAGSRREASASLQQLLHEHPEHVNSGIALALALSERGDNRSALRVAQQMLRQRPDSVPMLNLVRALKCRAHWSMWPLYPVQRWGWAGSIGVTLLAFIALGLGQAVLPPAVHGALLILWVTYVVYSWTWPRLLRRWM